MSENETPDETPELLATDMPSGGDSHEDWWATLVGLGLLVMALLGLIPDVVLW